MPIKTAASLPHEKSSRRVGRRNYHYAGLRHRLRRTVPAGIAGLAGWRWRHACPTNGILWGGPAAGGSGPDDFAVIYGHSIFFYRWFLPLVR
ncbi:MAG: hypothetical protein N839_0000530 [Desulfofustis sp. PB-SRB1]|nr:hypothetical protein [Desulfofustis sp. PB-SRB1]HBH27455.1 hypothetical protein [Desulfofustis sp.]HBH31676.1 hypothetical protein [Desulfofustis sp.]